MITWGRRPDSKAGAVGGSAGQLAGSSRVLRHGSRGGCRASKASWTEKEECLQQASLSISYSSHRSQLKRVSSRSLPRATNRASPQAPLHFVIPLDRKLLDIVWETNELGLECLIS